MKRKNARRFAALMLLSMFTISATAVSAAEETEAGLKKGQVLESAEVQAADNSQGSGGITPTVYWRAYRGTEEAQQRWGTFPESYDLRAEGLSTTVKNQTPWATCWSFSAVSSLESNVLTGLGASGSSESADPDYSELQLAWFAYSPQDDSSLAGSPAGVNQSGEGESTSVQDRLDLGGNMPQAAATLATWQGAAAESSVPYQNDAGTTDETGSWAPEESKRNESVVHVQDVEFLATTAKFSEYNQEGFPAEGAVFEYDEAAESAIKEALMDKGSVAIAYYADQSKPEGSADGTYFNYTNWCQYVDVLDSGTPMNHGVSIVGWDDTFSKDNFNGGKQPPEDGAWLVKNSWGTGWWGLENEGYFWLSYYDHTIDQVTSFQGEAAREDGSFTYDNNYQYDYLGMASNAWFLPQEEAYSTANVFTAAGNENLQAVSAFTNEQNVNVAVEVYRLPDEGEGPMPAGSVLVTKAEKNFTNAGYHTVRLDTPMTLQAGERFAVIETICGPSGYYWPIEIGSDNQTAVSNAGESFLILDGEYGDLSEISLENQTIGNAMIKAFTVNTEKPVPGLIQEGDKYRYMKENGEYARNEIIEIKGRSYYFGENTYRRANWVKLDDKWYHFSPKDDAMETGWKKISNRWYYLEPQDGQMETGWQKINSKWFWLGSDPDSGYMRIGWQKVNNKWFWLGSNPDSGSMRINWQKVNDKWYWFGTNPDEGWMRTDWKLVNNKWYWFGSNPDSGAMRIGWQKVGNEWFWMGSSPDQGFMRTGWQQTGGKYYYMYAPRGNMASDTWVDGYYVNKSGARVVR